MIITWTPRRSKRQVRLSQPEPDVLAIDEIEYDFSNRTIVEYTLPLDCHRQVVRAWRDDGVLHLCLIADYQAGNAITVERTIDYGTRRELSW